MAEKLRHKFEIPRKIVHLLSIFVPFAARNNLFATQALLGFFIVFYTYSEWTKLKGKAFFAHGPISKLQRAEEQARMARAPLFLAIGVLIAVSFFSFTAALIGVYQVAVCDTMAALVGKNWGQTQLPLLSRKTYVGTCAYFIAALPVSFYYLPPSKAIVIALVGAFLESLPFKDIDNLIIPIVIAFLAEQFLF